MKIRLNKPLFALPPMMRHGAIFLLGLFAVLSIPVDEHPFWVAIENSMLAMTFALIGLTFAIGSIVRGGSKIAFAVECVWLAFPMYLSFYALRYYAVFLSGGRH